MPSAPADIGSAGPRFIELTNAARDAAGLAAYSIASDLVDVAQGQADRMAAEHRIFHNPNLATDVVDWRKTGENVGVGRSPDTLNHALMASPHHRANLLSADFQEIGVGTTIGDNGSMYVAEVFRERADDPSANPLPMVSASPTDSVSVPVSEPSPAAAPARSPRSFTVTSTSWPLAARAAFVPTRLRPASGPTRGQADHVPGPTWIAGVLALGVLLAHAVVRRDSLRSISLP